MHMYVHTEISENKGVLAAERKNQDKNQVKKNWHAEKLTCRKSKWSFGQVTLWCWKLLCALGDTMSCEEKFNGCGKNQDYSKPSARNQLNSFTSATNLDNRPFICKGCSRGSVPTFSICDSQEGASLTLCYSSSMYLDNECSMELSSGFQVFPLPGECGTW